MTATNGLVSNAAAVGLLAQQLVERHPELASLVDAVVGSYLDMLGSLFDDYDLLAVR